MAYALFGEYVLEKQNTDTTYRFLLHQYGKWITIAAPLVFALKKLQLPFHLS